jgi:integrase
VQSIISAKLLTSPITKPREKPFEVHDTRLIGFVLRIQPSGYRAYYAHQGDRRLSLGQVGSITPDEARERCEMVLGNLAHGRPPMTGIAGGDSSPSLGAFVEESYAPWRRAHRPRTAQKTLDRIKLHFGDWYGRPLSSITLEDLERWRTKRINAGIAPTTAARDLSDLAGVLTRAVKFKHINDHVARQVEKLRVDRTPKVRYLDSAGEGEESRLRAALQARDADMIEARESANRWRADRGKELFPKLPNFGDHITPAVLVSMNTGLRRGELLNLKWDAIDWKREQVRVDGDTAKTEQTRHVPLNAEALDVLKRWKGQAPDPQRVFPIDTGFKTAWKALLKRARITGFRWHDLRHHFASRLVQAGVPLNTVRDLMGHQSLTMVLRYAHLAPDQKREAVALLVRPSMHAPSG